MANDGVSPFLECKGKATSLIWPEYFPALPNTEGPLFPLLMVNILQTPSEILEITGEGQLITIIP